MFLLALSAAGQACLLWYIMKHVWISAELRGGARRIIRRLAGCIWQGIAFRLPETSRSFGTPHIVFQMLIFNGFGKRFLFSRIKLFPESEEKIAFGSGFPPQNPEPEDF